MLSGGIFGRVGQFGVGHLLISVDAGLIGFEQFWTPFWSCRSVRARYLSLLVRGWTVLTGFGRNFGSCLSVVVATRSHERAV